MGNTPRESGRGANRIPSPMRRETDGEEAMVPWGQGAPGDRDWEFFGDRDWEFLGLGIGSCQGVNSVGSPGWHSPCEITMQGHTKLPGPSLIPGHHPRV